MNAQMDAHTALIFLFLIAVALFLAMCYEEYILKKK